MARQQSKKSRYRVVTVRTMIGSKGFGYLHDDPNGRRYWLHADRLRSDGFAVEDIQEDSILVIEATQRKRGSRWTVTKVHFVTAPADVPANGDRVSGQLIFSSWRQGFGVVLLGGVGSVKIDYLQLQGVSETERRRVTEGATLQFTLSHDQYRNLIGIKASLVPEEN